MIEICPKCLYRPTNEEHAYSPDSCPKCGCLYSAREQINEEKRRKNQQKKAWQVTRWRPKYRTGFALGIPAVTLIMYITYHIGQFVIAYNKPISNEIYALIREEPVAETQKTYTKKENIALKEKLDPYAPGVLKIRSKKTITITLIREGSNKKIGPVHIDKGKAKSIVMERGRYVAQIDDGKNSRITSISFLSEKGELDL